MGMFDSFYEGERETYEVEWQTKAYGRNLDVFWIGDRVPPLDGCDTYQVEILGGRRDRDKSTNSLATIVEGKLFSLDNERAHPLPLFNYSGHQVAEVWWAS